MRSSFLLLVPLLAACASKRVAGPDAVGHAVVFELADAGQVAALDHDLEALMAVTPGVLESHVGPRSDVALHDGINDTSFDLLLWVSFEDDEALHAYLESTRHVELVEAWMPRLAGVRVFDAWVGR